MPKPMLRAPQMQNKSQDLLSATSVEQRQSQVRQMDKLKLNRLLRRPRSKEYMETMRQLDAGGHVHNQNKVNEIINTIREEFPEVDISGVLIGFVAVCYLGPPYEVHTLDYTGQIIEHYKAGQPLENGMEKARSIAMRGGYAFIEVYVDCCRAVSADGTVSVIAG